MPDKEIIDYNPYTTLFKDLPCLEDAIHKSYSTEDEQNKTVQVSIREQPLSIQYAMYSLLNEGIGKYISVIERHAIYYAVSVIQESVAEIAEKHQKISEEGSVRDLHMLLNSSTGIPFCTMTGKERANISLPSWCMDWISSNHRYLNLPSGRFAVFLLILALDTAEIKNKQVKKEVHTEAEWFREYLNKCNKI